MITDKVDLVVGILFFVLGLAGLISSIVEVALGSSQLWLTFVLGAACMIVLLLGLIFLYSSVHEEEV